MFNKLKQLIIKLYNDQRIRFLFVGCLNTVVGWGVENLCYLLMGYGLNQEVTIKGWQIFVATATGYALGTVNSYFWNKYFTFKSTEKSFAEVLRFVSVCVVQCGVHFGLMFFIQQFIRIPLINTAIVTLICMVVSYLGHSLFSFSKRFAKKEIEE